jgi:hypothetical protein
VKDWEARVDDAKVKFYKMVSASLDKGLDSVYVFGVLVYSWIVCEKKEFGMGYTTEGSCVIEFIFV